jgi:hypothetical protein
MAVPGLDPGIVPAIHDLFAPKKDVDGRDKHGHDDLCLCDRPGNTNALTGISP